VDPTNEQLSVLEKETGRTLTPAPVADKRLLELKLSWADLDEPHRRMAERLRVRVHTYDPFDFLDERWGGLLAVRPRAKVTTRGIGDDVEILLYLPLARIDHGRHHGDLVDEMAAYAETVVRAAVEHEEIIRQGSYPERVFEDDLDLLAGFHRSEPTWGRPTVDAPSGWEPIGFDTVVDLGREAHGPTDLDLSPVRLQLLLDSMQGCPACAGERFAFAPDLVEAIPAMCSTHAEEAETLADARFARALESNPDGMAAIIEAGDRLDRPHLPYCLREDLDEIFDDSAWNDAMEEELAERDVESLDSLSNEDKLVALEAVVARAGPLHSAMEFEVQAQVARELHGHFADRPDDLVEAAGDEWDSIEFWLQNLSYRLAGEGLFDDALEWAEKSCDLIDERQPYGSWAELATAMARAGRRDEAFELAERAAAGGTEIWMPLLAATAFAEAGRPHRAEELLRGVIGEAQTHGDDDIELDATFQLAELLGDDPDRADEATALEARVDQMRMETRSRRQQALRHRGRPHVDEGQPKVGRNDPCPCGSGKKHKHCHGR
jgi:hypothetical protein